MVMERDLTLGTKHMAQFTDAILQNCTPGTCIILLTNVTPINSTKIKRHWRTEEFTGAKVAGSHTGKTVRRQGRMEKQGEREVHPLLHIDKTPEIKRGLHFLGEH